MKKSRFSESQIVSILKKADGGLKVEAICRQHGISSATYYNLNSGFDDPCQKPDRWEVSDKLDVSEDVAVPV